MGDIVHLQDKPYQWANANEAMSILDGVVPYCFALGNHDLVNAAEEGSGIVRDSRNFNNIFGHSRYEKQPWFGGRMNNDGFLPKDNYDNSYLEGNGSRVVSDPYIPTGPGNTGQAVWEKFVRKHSNIFFVFCGHHNNLPDHKGLLASRGDNGNTVYQLISGEDYDGWLRILRFVPAEDKIYVRTYSPWRPAGPELQYKQYSVPLPGYNTDPYHQYELEYQQ